MAKGASEAVADMLNELADALGEEAMLSVVDVYEENSLAQITQMEQAVIYADMPKIQQEAHSLKSSSANLGAQELADLCFKIEKTQTFDSSVAAMVDECKRLRTEASLHMAAWKKSKS